MLSAEKHFLADTSYQLKYQISRLLGKNPQGDHSGGIQTHNLCITRADVLPLATELAQAI